MFGSGFQGSSANGAEVNRVGETWTRSLRLVLQDLDEWVRLLEVTK